MKKFTIIFLIAVSLIGCSSTDSELQDTISRLKPNQTKTIVEQEQDPNPTSTYDPKPTPTIKPSPTMRDMSSDLKSEKIGWGYSDFYITYAPKIWNVVEHDDEYSDLTYNRLELVEDPNCVFYESLGRGFEQADLELEVTQVKMGAFDCQVKELRYTENGEYFLVLFNFDEEQIFITVEPGNDPAACVEAARIAIQNSAKNAFGPISRYTSELFNNWSLINNDIHPSARSGYGFAYDEANNNLVLFGGTCDGYACNDTWIYNTSGWKQLRINGPGAREDVRMVYDSVRRRVVLFGGHIWADGYYGDTWEFDGSKWTEIFTVNSPENRSNQAMTYDVNRGKVVLFGGWKGSQSGYDILGDTWEYDGTEWTRIITQKTPGPRSGARLVYAHDWGVVVLFGGKHQEDNMNTYPSDVWKYDGKEWTQIQVTSGPKGRFNPQLAYDPVRQVVVMYGGYRDDTRTTFDDTWEFNGSEWEKTKPAINPPSIWAASIINYPPMNGILMFGGNSPHQNDLSGSMWRYGPE